ncbi:hypothetical protein LIER_15956 [Lithospermum erythrorhizon]|uniref:Uncharacterized protein n=1 Tax=Lithospermum erythrorhizon TaxID=34254 RepID=A0AAV3Q4V2_LITER
MKTADLTPSKEDNICIQNNRTVIDPKEIKRCNAGDLNSISVEKKKLTAGNKSKERKTDPRMSVERILPVVLALEHPHPDHVCDQLKPRDKKNSTDQTSTVWQSHHKIKSKEN